MDGDQRDHEKDVSIKAGNDHDLGFDNLGATCDCDGSVTPTANSLAGPSNSELPNLQVAPVFDAPKLRAYPNPSSSDMTIEFSVPETTRAVIELYDIHGRRVARVFEQDIDAGQIYRRGLNACNYRRGPTSTACGGLCKKVKFHEILPFLKYAML